MLFFLILPVWAVATAVGLVLLPFKAMRWLGLYILSTSTLATVGAFCFSLLGLFAVGGVAKQIGAGDWTGIAALGGYGAGLLGGGALGVLLGFLLVLFFHLRSRRRSA